MFSNCVGRTEVKISTPISLIDDPCSGQNIVFIFLMIQTKLNRVSL